MPRTRIVLAELNRRPTPRQTSVELTQQSPVGEALLRGLIRTRLPWLLLGLAAYPFLFVVGAMYVRITERTEAEFTDLVERPR
jgi:hypothetical protein